jgi:hypothetical protein
LEEAEMWDAHILGQVTAPYGPSNVFRLANALLHLAALVGAECGTVPFKPTSAQQHATQASHSELSKDKQTEWAVASHLQTLADQAAVALVAAAVPIRHHLCTTGGPVNPFHTKEVSAEHGVLCDCVESSATHHLRRLEAILAIGTLNASLMSCDRTKSLYELMQMITSKKERKLHFRAGAGAADKDADRKASRRGSASASGSGSASASGSAASASDGVSDADQDMAGGGHQPQPLVSSQWQRPLRRWKCTLFMPSITQSFRRVNKVYANSSTLDGIRKSLQHEHTAETVTYDQLFKPINASASVAEHTYTGDETSNELYDLKVQLGVNGQRVAADAPEVMHASTFRNLSDAPLHVVVTHWFVRAQAGEGTWLPVPNIPFEVPPRQTVSLRSAKLHSVRQRHWQTGAFPESKAPVRLDLIARFYHQLDAQTLPPPLPTEAIPAQWSIDPAASAEQQAIKDAAMRAHFDAELTAHQAAEFVRDGGYPIPRRQDEAFAVHQMARRGRIAPKDWVVPFNKGQKEWHTVTEKCTRSLCVCVCVCV